MPVLVDPKRERFAQLLARGLNTTEAYARAGYQRNSGNAASMRKRADVIKRVEEIRSGMAEENQQALDDYLKEAGIDHSYIIKQILETGLEARSSGKFTDALTAFKTLGTELFGMFTDGRSKNNNDKNANNISTTITVQDFSRTYQDLSKALEPPTIDGEAIRIDDLGKTLSFNPGATVIDQ